MYINKRQNIINNRSLMILLVIFSCMFLIYFNIINFFKTNNHFYNMLTFFVLISLFQSHKLIRSYINKQFILFWKYLQNSLFIFFIPLILLIKQPPTIIAILELTLISMIIIINYSKNIKKTIFYILSFIFVFLLSESTFFNIFNISFYSSTVCFYGLSILLFIANGLIFREIISCANIYSMKTRILVSTIYTISLSLTFSLIIGYFSSSYQFRFLYKFFRDSELFIFSMLYIILFLFIYRINKILTEPLSHLTNKLESNSNNNEINIINKHIKNISKEAKEYLERLKDTERKFRYITENSTDIIWIIDIDLNIKYISSGILTFSGYTADEIIQSNQLKYLYSRDGYSKLIELKKEILSRIDNKELPEKSKFETEMYHKNGKKIWGEINLSVIYDENKNPLEIIGITRNITDRKLYEIKLKKTTEELTDTLKKLSRSEKKYKYLVDNSNDVFWTMTPELNLTYVSPKVYELQGITQKEALEMPFEKKFPAESMQIFMGMAQDILEMQGKPSSRNYVYSKTYQLPQYHKDGHEIMTEVSLTVLFDESGMAQEAIGVTRDISSRIEYQKKIEKFNQELKEANDELKTLDEMKTNLLSNVSHELRTPLASIKGYTSMILTGASGDLTEKQKKQLSIVNKNIEHLIGLIESLLSYSRLDLGQKALQLKNIDIVKTANEVIDMIKSKKNSKNIDIVLTHSNDKIIGCADYRQIKQVFINLIDNAFKFSPENSHIHINIEQFENDIIIKIKDEGIGISRENLRAIFERFYQVDTSSTRHYQGMGLGLSIVKKILDLHNGSIDVKSVQGEGTEFIIKICAGDENFTEETLKIESDENIIINSELSDDTNVLVVDDQDELLDFIKELFTENNINCITINNAKNVEEYVKNNHISVAFLDISMADISGLELCKKIKNIDSSIPVIMLSAFSEEKYKNQAKEYGAEDFIVKPFDIHELIDKVYYYSNRQK